jgi:hypothetical protein
LSSSYPVARLPVAVAVAIVVVARRAVAIIVLESIQGHPILVWGSPYRFGDTQTKTGIPEPKWGCESQRIPKPIRGSPNQNGDQYIPIPKQGSQNRFGDCSVTKQNRFGVCSDLGLKGFVPKLERHSKQGPHIWNGDPHIETGTPRIGFQIGESQNRFGVHSNLGTNIYPLTLCLHFFHIGIRERCTGPTRGLGFFSRTERVLDSCVSLTNEESLSV